MRIGFCFLMSRVTIGLLLAGCLLALSSARAEPYHFTGNGVAVDGDSLRFDDVRARLQGIDAPELNQTCIDRAGQPWSCGKAAHARLAALIEGRNLDCNVLDEDRYGRIIVRCTTRGRDIGRAMVQAGLALAYRKYSNRYVADEDDARMARRGIWQGDFEAPWKYRRR
jgi:endonuclease YncB( thermonuclease family)